MADREPLLLVEGGAVEALAAAPEELAMIAAARTGSVVREATRAEAALTITAGARKAVPKGKRIPLPPNVPSVLALRDAIAGLPPAIEAWWSPHVWGADSRNTEAWKAACAIVLDLDYYDDSGRHAHVPGELRLRFAELWKNRGPGMGSLCHHTPRGERVIFVLEEQATNPKRYLVAAEGAAAWMREALGAADLLVADPLKPCGGFQVDPCYSDLARLLYTPSAIVDGEPRRFGFLDWGPPFTLAALIQRAPPPPPPPTPKPQPAKVRQHQSSMELEEAISRWNYDRPADWPRSGGDCPACGHHGCFGHHPENPGRWVCFSTNHEADSSACGIVSLKGVWTGDALDLEAHGRGRARADVLRTDGYLADWVRSQPPPSNGGHPHASEHAGEGPHPEPALAPRIATLAEHQGEQAQDGTPTQAAPPAAPTEAPQPTEGERPVFRPTIMVRAELAPVVDEAERALLQDPGAGVYVRAHHLVRVVADSGHSRAGLKRAPGSPVIQLLPVEALRERLDRAAEWVAYDRRSKTEHSALPPAWVAPTLSARGSWPFPPLEGVIEAPTLRPDGELLDRPGYDPDTGLLYLPSGDFPAVPSRPTGEDVRAALALLLEPFLDFPFVEDGDRAAAVAAVLSLTARHAIPGCVPMFAVRAPAPGVGKGLLADVLSMIAYGRPAARMTLPPEVAELRKVILAVALEGTPLVLLDNVDRALGSASLAAALTAQEWEDRVLGVSARVRAPLRAVWVATGNGLTFHGDLGRRVIPVDLDPECEHPEDRTGFRHPDLIGWTHVHRGELVAAGLTLLRAFHLAGRPVHGKPAKGSFEAWDALARAACVWAGLADPAAGGERIRREDDSDLAALRAALAAWHGAFGDNPHTAAEAVAEALRCEGADPPNPELRDALLALTPAKDRLDSRALSYALRRARGRIVGGLRFETAGEARGGYRWTVAGAEMRR